MSWLRRLPWVPLLIVTAAAVVSVLIAALLTSLALSARASRGNTDELLRQGRQDRICQIALVFEATDPRRDVSRPLQLPDACDESSAAEEAVDRSR